MSFPKPQKPQRAAQCGPVFVIPLSLGPVAGVRVRQFEMDPFIENESSVFVIDWLDASDRAVLQTTHELNSRVEPYVLSQLDPHWTCDSATEIAASEPLPVVLRENNYQLGPRLGADPKQQRFRKQSANETPDPPANPADFAGLYQDRDGSFEVHGPHRFTLHQYLEIGAGSPPVHWAVVTWHGPAGAQEQVYRWADDPGDPEDSQAGEFQLGPDLEVGELHKALPCTPGTAHLFVAQRIVKLSGRALKGDLQPTWWL